MREKFSQELLEKAYKYAEQHKCIVILSEEMIVLSGESQSYGVAMCDNLSFWMLPGGILFMSPETFLSMKEEWK